MSRLIGYEVEKVGIIKIFRMEIDGRYITKYTGANAQGKSSALNALEMLLNTKNVPQEPIQHGAEKGHIIGRFDTDKGEIIVRKLFDKNYPRGKLSVKINGVFQTSPQSILDELLGLISFNPLDFCESDKEEQKEMLLEVLNIKDEILLLDEEYKKLFADRTILGRDKKRLIVIKDKLKNVGKILPIDIRAILDNREKAILHNKGNDRLKEELKKTENTIEDTLYDGRLSTKKIQELEELLEETKKNLENEIKNREKLVKEHRLAKLTKVRLEKEVQDLIYKDTTIYDRQLEQVDNTNTQAQLWKEKQEKQAEFDVLVAESIAINNRMKDIKAEKEIIFQESTFPIDGMTFTEEGVRYKDVLVSDISRAQQLLVGCAIMTALNPTLRLVLMDDAEKLDSKSLKVIEDWAEKNELYVLMAMVEESGEVGIVFKEGEEVANEYKEKVD